MPEGYPEISAVLGFKAAWNGSFLPTSWANPSVPSSKVKDGTNGLSRNVGNELPFYAA